MLSPTGSATGEKLLFPEVGNPMLGCEPAGEKRKQKRQRVGMGMHGCTLRTLSCLG